MIYIGVGIVFLMVIAGTWFIIGDIAKKNSNFNRHVIPFRGLYDKSGLPLMQLKINGKYEWFLIDSGASANMIKDSFIDSMSKKPEIIGGREVYNVSESIKSKVYSITTKYKMTKFGNESFNSAQLNAFDFKAEEWGVNVVGIIGSPFFEKYGWTICFKTMNIYVNK